MLEHSQLVVHAVSLFAKGRSVIDLVGDEHSPMRVLNIYESLDANTSFGTILMEDASGLLETYPIVGMEYVLVSFSNNKLAETEPVTKLFRVVAIKDIQRDPNRPVVIYTLELATSTLIESNKQQLQCSFRNKTEAEIITAICKDNLNISDKLLDIEDSQYKRNWTAPNMTPFQVIDAMTNQAITARESRAANFFFYENKNGYNFKSLETLLKAEPVATLRTVIQNLELKSDNVVSNIIEVQLNSITQPAKNRKSGAHGHTVKEIDLLEKKVNEYTYSLEDMYKYLLPTDKKNNLPFVNDEDSYRSVITPIHNHGNFSHSARAFPTRLLTNQLLDNINISVTINGNSNLTIGDKVVFEMPTMDPLELGKAHKYLSGNWIISEIKHSIVGSKYTTNVTMFKPSFKNEIEFE